MKLDGYNPAVAEMVAELCAENKSFQEIAQILKLSGVRTLYRWMYRYPEFLDLVSKAKNTQAEAIDQEMIKLAEHTRQGLVDPSVARVLFPWMQWRAGKKNPKAYGDKTILAGDAENPINLLATRLDEAILNHSKMIDVTPVESPEAQYEGQNDAASGYFPSVEDDGSDLV